MSFKGYKPTGSTQSGRQDDSYRFAPVVDWGTEMRYDLSTAESKEKIGDVILDESPEVGCEVRCAGATYRVTRIVWMQNVKSNSVSSGLLCVEPVKADPERLPAT